MMVRVFVSLKSGVLDPQGMTIQRALQTMGNAQARSVRQGKYFEIQWEGDLRKLEEREHLERIAAQVLSNPVIECYSIEWPDGSSA